MGGFTMAVAHLGFYFAKYFNEIGLNATLIIKESHLHEWRRLNPEEDPYKNRLIKIIPHKKYENKFIRQLREISQIRHFDIVLSIAAAGMWYLPTLKKPYVAYATGADLGELAAGKGYSGFQVKQAQKFFKNAKLVFFGAETAHLEMIKRLELRKTIPWRQIIDTKFWGPNDKKIEDNESLLILNPSGQQWIPKFKGQRLKGNDIFFKGFALFLEQGGKGKAFYVRRGQNVVETKGLVKKLNLSENVIELEQLKTPLERKKRIEEMDVIADQFSEGMFGLIALESMSMGKPVLAYVSDSASKLIYPEEKPPILNASNPEEVAQQLHQLLDQKNRLEISKNSRKWIEDYHDPIKLAKWYWENIKKNL